MPMDDDVERKKSSFLKATGVNGARRVRTNTNKQTMTPKPPAFAFAMKKFPTATSKGASGKSVGGNTSSFQGGAVRVPVFGKKAIGGASAASSTTAKTPFSALVKTKGVSLKAPATPVAKTQPRVALPLGNFSGMKRGETKAEQKPKGAQQQTKAVAKLLLKPFGKTAKFGASPSTFSRVKISAKPQTVKGQDQAVPKRSIPEVAKKIPNKGSRFQLNPRSSVENPASFVSSEANELCSPNASTSHAVEAGGSSKKRTQGESSPSASTPAKKKRVEDSTPSGSKTLAVLNIVSPEARISSSRSIATMNTASVTDSDHQGQNTSVEVTAKLEFSTAKSSILSLPSIPNPDGRTASPPGTFVTAEEEEMVSTAAESDVLEAESDSFLKRVRDLQLFIDEVNVEKHCVFSTLLDSNALANECLLDILADATALTAGLTLMELTEISTKIQDRIDKTDENDVDETFFC